MISENPKLTLATMKLKWWVWISIGLSSIGTFPYNMTIKFGVEVLNLVIFSSKNLTILTENPFLWSRPWALPLNHCVSCGELSGTHHCPERATTLPVKHWESRLPSCTLVEYAALSWPDLPGVFNALRLESTLTSNSPFVLPIYPAMCPADWMAIKVEQKTDGDLHLQLQLHLLEFVLSAHIAHARVHNSP